MTEYYKLHAESLKEYLPEMTRSTRSTHRTAQEPPSPAVSAFPASAAMLDEDESLSATKPPSSVAATDIIRRATSSPMEEDSMAV